MPLQSPYKCWRNRTDCISLASTEGIPDDATEEQVYELSFEPLSFVCCGCIQTSDRKIKQDAYRICFKNDVCDEMSDNDDQDLAHLAYVISQAQAIIATRRVNRGTITVLDTEGDMLEVETKQVR